MLSPFKLSGLSGRSLEEQTNESQNYPQQESNQHLYSEVKKSSDFVVLAESTPFDAEEGSKTDRQH